MMPTEPISIKTERLVLRSVHPDDAADMYAYRSKPEVNQYLGFKPDSLEHMREFITHKIAPTINQVNTWHQFAMVHTQTNTVIGDIGLHFFDAEGHQMEVGYTLSDAHRGKGYATEALSAAINFLFNQLGKRRITASIDPENLPSLALVERLGFRKEAHFRESLFMDGKWVDDVIYAMLKSDWLRLHSEK
jgi:RimJ/RimL family protein N-acetyltransferase